MRANLNKLYMNKAGESMELNLGEKIRQKRKAMGLTLKELAGNRVTAAQISAVEKGKCKPSPGLLKYISDTLGVEIDYFTMSDEERCRKKFDEIKAVFQKAYENKEYDKVMEETSEFNDCFSLLSDVQKGYFSYIRGSCLYEENKHQDAFELYVKSLTYYLKTKDKNTIADIYMKIGNCLYNTEKYDMALGYYLSAYKYTHENINYDLKCKILYNLSLCYLSLKRYNLSRKYLDELIEFLNNNELPDKKKYYPGIDMMNGLIDKEMNENKISLKKFDEALNKYKLEGDIKGMGRAKNNAAICCWDAGEKEKAVELFKEAIDYKIICQDETLIDTYLNLCELYDEIGQPDKVDEVIGAAEEKMMKQNNTQGLIEIFIAKFDYSVKKAGYDRAEVYAFIALDYIQKSGNKKLESELYVKLSEMYRKMGDEKSSIDYLIKAKSLEN